MANRPSSKIKIEAAASSDRSYAIKVLERTTTILDVFTLTRPTLGLSETAKRTNLPKPTTFRILSNLVDRGYCEIDPFSGQYGLGPQVLKLAGIRRAQNTHKTMSQLMHNLHAELNETIVLSVRTRDHFINIDAIESAKLLKYSAEIGVPVWLHLGASGRALLAGMSDAEVGDYVNRTFRASEREITKKLWQEIELIRKRSYAENMASGGAPSIAAPVRDYSGKSIAAVEILVPQERLVEAHRHRCIELLLAMTRPSSQGNG